jgi:hypothetical protein
MNYSVLYRFVATRAKSRARRNALEKAEAAKDLAEEQLSERPPASSGSRQGDSA